MALHQSFRPPNELCLFSVLTRILSGVHIENNSKAEEIKIKYKLILTILFPNLANVVL